MVVAPPADFDGDIRLDIVAPLSYKLGLQ